MAKAIRAWESGMSYGGKHYIAEREDGKIFERFREKDSRYGYVTTRWTERKRPLEWETRTWSDWAGDYIEHEPRLMSGFHTAHEISAKGLRLPNN